MTHPRTDARRRALDALFSADLLGTAVDVSQKGLDKLAKEIVKGVSDHAGEIDETIRRCADRWTLERMPIVDRNLLRIGIYEILWDPSVPAGAAINDLVELAKLLSTEDSGRFVNGLLGRVAREAAR